MRIPLRSRKLKQIAISSGLRASLCIEVGPDIGLCSNVGEYRINPGARDWMTTTRYIRVHPDIVLHLDVMAHARRLHRRLLDVGLPQWMHRTHEAQNSHTDTQPHRTHRDTDTHTPVHTTHTYTRRQTYTQTQTHRRTQDVPISECNTLINGACELGIDE